MKNKKTIYKNIIHQNHFNLNLYKNLKVRYNKILFNTIKNKDDEKDFFYSLNKNFKFDFKIKDIKKFKKYKKIVLIGMGGSILGSKAIYSFLKKKIKIKVHFFDNLDEEKLISCRKRHNLSQTLYIALSKSGETLETLTNLLNLKILKKNSKNLIVITEKNNRSLHLLSKKLNCYFVEHKRYIGGRYSIFSEVGMLPAYLMGLRINNLRKNILVHFKNRKKKIFLRDSAIKLAAILLKNKIRSFIFFNYEPKLDNFLYWYQQLIAESLGKKGKGFLPVISPAPKDHHSLLQLYLDGPKDKLFYIFSSTQDLGNKISSKKLNKELKYLNNQSLNKIKNAQKNALIQILKKKNIPFREFQIGTFNEETLGELFSYFAIETALVGKVTNINPFDQPAVEQMKKITRKQLA